MMRLNDDYALPDLDAAARAVVTTALHPRPRGFFSDVDGTLSAIAPTPESAVLLPGVRVLLERARAVFDFVAAVSGRSASDTRRLVGLPGITYIGNHGMERLEPDSEVWSGTGDAGALTILPAAEPYVAAINDALDAIEVTLAPRFPGLRIERKGVTGSVHVRNTAEPAAAEEAVARALSTIAIPRDLYVTRGKMVVELRPPVEMNKGIAVEELIRAHGLRAALYLGDDRTDIDAFHMLRRLTQEGVCQGVTVAILHPEAPADLAAAADITLPSVERVPAFLHWLLEDAS